MVKSRCCADSCKTKLGMMDFSCGCGGKYCLKHRLPEEHECTFSHKEKALQILEDRLLNEKTENCKISNKL